MLRQVLLICWLGLIMLWDVVTAPIAALFQHLEHCLKLGPEETLKRIQSQLIEYVEEEQIQEDEPATKPKLKNISEYQDADEEFMRKATYDNFNSFRNFAQDPVNGGGSVVKVCADYASYLRLAETVNKINAAPEAKTGRIKLDISGVPDEAPEGDDPYDGPYWCDISCPSSARLEQLIHDVDLLEMLIEQISYLNTLELELAPDAPAELKNSSHPWPWHPYETVRINEVPVSEVPYWKE